MTFQLPPDFAGGGVSNVPGMLMKSNEHTRGTPLAGLAVKVTDNFFLIGLSNVNADRGRNLQLLKDRAWLDIPLVYTNQRRAILALEKGALGERAFKDAFTAWAKDYPTASNVQPEPGTGSGGAVRYSPPLVPTPASPVAPAATGGFMVQIASQRSEADAHASYRAVQSKFPDVLGSRSVFIPRAAAPMIGHRVEPSPFDPYPYDRCGADSACDYNRPPPMPTAAVA